MFKKFLYKAQNIQLVQLFNGKYALRKGWIFYRFADFDCVNRNGTWEWREYESMWFKDCQESSKEKVLTCIEKYFTHKKYRVIPVDISESFQVSKNECCCKNDT